MKTITAPQRKAAGGFTLIEALVALLVLAFGMLAVAGFQLTLSRNSDVAKQRSEATRLAQKKIDEMRAFVQRSADADPADDLWTYAQQVAGDAQTLTSVMTNTAFTVTTTVDDTWSGDRYRSVHVLVTWADRTGGAQQVSFDSIVSDGDPSDIGALAVGRATSRTLKPSKRSVNIPYRAVSVAGGGQSAFMPPPGSVVFVFNNVTGTVEKRCTGVATLTEGIDLSGASCVSIDAYLLSGFVRFKTTGAADASNIENPTDMTQPLQIWVGPSNAPVSSPVTIDASATGNGPAGYECFSQQQKAVRNSSTGEELTIAETDPVPAGFSDIDAPRFVSYACVVDPVDDDGVTGTPEAWWGEVRLNPDGWVIGSADGQREVCRFSSDYNNNDLLSNNEHPRYYRRITGALGNQNYLVINGSDRCPSDVAADALGDDFVSTNTAGHQPATIAELSFECLDAGCSGGNRVALETATLTTPLPME